MRIPKNMLTIRLSIAGCLWAALGGMTVCAQESLTPDQLKFFESRIRPVLVTECYRCHAQQTGKVEGSLRVDNAQSLRLGGDSGPAIDLEDYQAGTLWQAINHDGIEMPPGRRLPQNVIDDFEIWLKQGAPDPRTLELDQAPSTVTEADIEAGREFWSFQEVSEPPVPRSGTDWPQSSIDQFLAVEWEAQGIPTPADASPEVVLRRLCFDLLGVPPTSEQLSWFVQLWEEDPDQAMSQAVDRMLDSPKFGERWGRHWLDIARYAESTGKEINSSFPHAWRYRDYVIDSFNADKPYDQFLKEQLAGDLLEVDSDQQWTQNLVATGFLALGPKTLLERSQRQFEADVIDEQIDVTTRSLLGVSVACARCHDHKFEAITQKDYYAVAGIFGNMETYFGGTASRRNRNSTRLIELPVQDRDTEDFRLSEDEIEQVRDQIKKLNEEIADLNRPQRDRRSNDAGSSKDQQNQAAVNQQQRRQMVRRLTATRTTLQNTLDSLDKQGRQISVCMGVQPVENPRDARLLARGEVDQPGETVPRGFVSVLAAQPPTIAADSSGRLEFANWVASADNPLTTRVMANRVWLHLMGQGIVRTPEDFGVTGSAPSHPELLDFLATRLVQNQWSIKSLIREIVTSRAYRMSSDYQSVAAAKDPENHYFWRRSPQQLEAEALRDSMLMVSGELETERPRGSIVASVGPAEAGRRGQTTEILFRLQQQAAQKDDSMSRRERALRMRKMAEQRARTSLTDEALNQSLPYRSVYLPVVRDHVPRSLELFDFAEPSMVVGDRDQSQTAPQALYLLNSDFVWQQSMALADSARDQSTDLASQLNWVFRTCYSRDASAEELDWAMMFIERQEAVEPVGQTRSNSDRGTSSVDGLAVFCQALLTSAEFRMVY